MEVMSQYETNVRLNEQKLLKKYWAGFDAVIFRTQAYRVVTESFSTQRFVAHCSILLNSLGSCGDSTCIHIKTPHFLTFSR